MARSHARIHVSAYDAESRFTDLPLHLQGLYWLLVARRDINFCGVLPYKPKVWAAGAADDVERVTELVDELEQLDYVVIDHDTDELWVRTYIHHDQVLAMPQVAMTMARQYDTVYSSAIRSRIREALPPGLRDGFPTNLTASRKQVADLLEEHDAKGYKPTRNIPCDNPSDMGCDNPSGTLPENPSDMGSGMGLGTVDGGRWTGVEGSTVQKTPQPPAERGADDDAEHHGQHANCRRCGTNPRGAKPAPPPDPGELHRRALDAEAELNAARARGDTCATCEGTLWVDTDGGVTRCPDCTAGDTALVRAALATPDAPHTEDTHA
jgi:hypothetical protein